MTLSRLLRFRKRPQALTPKAVTVDEDGPGLTIRLEDAPREPNAESARILPLQRRPEAE